MLGHINVTGISYTENCAGTPSDLCYLYLNFTPVRDIYVQANDMWLESSPPVKSLKLQRTWGPSWRTIDLNKTWSTQVKYAIKFAKGQDYRIRFIAEKYDPRDVIEWDINPTGIWGVAKPKYKCDEETITWTEEIPHYKEVTYYTAINKTNPKPEAYTVTELDYIEYVKHKEEQCIKGTDYISYAESNLDISNMGCTIFDSSIVCDLIYTGDANGDGICQSGETCATYDLTDKIELKSIMNGLVKVK